MPAHGEPKIYDLLASQAVSATTIKQLFDSTKNTYIEERNVEFWAGVITVARALEESRTYAQGNLPIPEQGYIESNTIANGANTSVLPTGTEVWQVIGIENAGCSFVLVDENGTTVDITVDPGAPRLTNIGPLYLSAAMGFKIFNSSGDEKTPKFAYFKVSL